MGTIRQAICSHTETVRDLVVQLLTIDSGIYDTSQLKTILEQPDSTVQLETDWLNSLLEALEIMQEYLQLVNRWEEHTFGLIKNLQGSQNDIKQFERQEKSASELLQSKTFETDYLLWVLQDTAQELDRLIAATQELIEKGPRLSELAETFRGPFFERVQQIVQVWMTTGRRDFFAPLVNLLQETHDQADAQYILNRLCRYLDTIAHVVSSTPMFVVEPTKTTSYSPQVLRSSHGVVEQLIQGTENLNKFVQLRTQSYMLLLREQDAILRAVLPLDTPVSQVLITLGLNKDQGVDSFLPDKLSTDALPLAMEQAEEALNAWNNSIEAAVPYLNKALVLNQLLQSPAITKFLNADKQRLKIYREWRSRIQHTFEAVKEANET